MGAWIPEIVVDEALARRLIDQQFPEFESAVLRLFGEGWDNTVWLAAERVVFRFPRRAMAVPGLEREIRFLPLLAPLVPLAIPVPTYVGSPAAGFPWPFFGAPSIPGEEIASAQLIDSERIRLARPLGEFLRALHGAPVLELPADPMGRADMARRVPAARQALAEAGQLGLWHAPPEVAQVIAAAEGLPPVEATVVAHGDLHLRHVLVAGGELAGVIDWNDICLAHRSVDLVLYWSLLPPGGRSELLAAYGAVSEEDLLRARVLSLNLCAILAVYARKTGNASLEAESLRGLELTAQD